MLRLLIIFVALAALLGGIYFYWTTTPFYAFQEAGLAAKDHNLSSFEERVDVRNLIENLMNDLLVLPASTTPGLTHFQREVGAGSVTLARLSIEAEVIRRIEDAVSQGRPDQQSMLAPIDNFGMAPAMATADQPSKGNLSDLLRATTHEVSGEIGKLKRDVYFRMEAYAEQHPTTLPGRLLLCRNNQRGEELRRMLDSYGLTKENFRSISSWNTTDDGLGNENSKIGFNFYSPKVNHEVTLEIELVKSESRDYWRISRISNVSQLLAQEGENYEYDVHSLMAASLSGISSEKFNSDVRGMGERISDKIKENKDAQRFLQQFNIHLGPR